MATRDRPDPHGLRARLDALNLTQAVVARRLDVAPNSITRAITTTQESDVRPRLDALLRRLEETEGGTTAQRPSPAARDLGQIVGAASLADVHIEYLAAGKVRRLVVLLADDDLTAEEQELVRKLREGRSPR